MPESGSAATVAEPVTATLVPVMFCNIGACMQMLVMLLFATSILPSKVENSVTEADTVPGGEAISRGGLESEHQRGECRMK
jgi:hypothetical protein